VTVGRKRDEVKPNGKNWANLRANGSLRHGPPAARGRRRKSCGQRKSRPRGRIREGRPAGCVATRDDL